ncbi:hypothetical protein [Mycobacterium sp.]|uniref:hypothetical protein n=1 Tax=Mycobacterium sp. TaxID=1785 RepID=UPI002BADF94F|nr:hypothetical protein [Mycobacterium sp.]HTQ22055.1 hypothetical protein [Mycobacterium sp.]
MMPSTDTVPPQHPQVGTNRTRRQYPGAGKAALIAAVIVVFAVVGVLVIRVIANHAGSQTAAPIPDMWQNVDPKTRGIVQIDIAEVPDGLTIHPWGACLPTPCDWGTQLVHVPRGAATWDVRWSPSFAVEDQHYTRLPDGRLNVTTHTHFTDDSGRADYDSDEDFART